MDEEITEEDRDEITQEDVWKVLNPYFKNNGFVQHHLDSFKKFILDIPDIMEEEAGKYIKVSFKDTSRRQHVDIKIKFGDIYLTRPHWQKDKDVRLHMYPNIARSKNMSYSCRLQVDVIQTLTQRNSINGQLMSQTKQGPKKHDIGTVPIMIRSDLCFLQNQSGDDLIRLGECPNDPGGYFIINGKERVLIAQEKINTNQVYVYKDRQPSKYTYVAEVRSMRESQKGPTSKIYVRMVKGNRGSSERCIRATLPYTRTEIPIIIVFHALGLVTEKDIIEHICYDVSDQDMTELLRPSLLEASPIRDTQVALDYIGKRGVRLEGTKEKRILHAQNILLKEMLPHVGIKETCESQKAFYLVYVVRQILLCTLRRRREDDLDHLGNKRLDLAGPLLGGLFRTLFRKLIKNLKHEVEKKYHGGLLNLKECIMANIITNGLNYSLGTGNWTGTNRRSGVSQVLNRLNYMSVLSHLRRPSCPIEQEAKPGKATYHRHLHNTHWGMMCPAETPSGAACGLVKNLALMTHITVGSKADPILDYLRLLSLEDFQEITPAIISQSAKVFVNGCWVGIHRNPKSLVENLKALRRTTAEGVELGIFRDYELNDVRIYTDYGRCIRPLFIVEKQRLLIKKRDIEALEPGESQDGEVGWHKLLRQGLIEYIDAKEEETTMISMTIEDLVSARQQQGGSSTYTHCEIHPSLIMGVCASLIPFPNHNQSVRNTYQSAMCKQSLGIYATNYQLRMDNFASILYYPQTPLVTTRAMEHLNFRQLPAGNNVVVAIASYGFNQGDAIVMNKSSIDRGLFRSVSFRTYSDKEKLKQKFGKPNKQNTSGMKGLGSYAKLDEDGFPAPGKWLSGGDVIIGKTTQIPEYGLEDATSKFKHYDCSMSIHRIDSGMVDKVLLTDVDGFKLVKVRTRSVRVPQIGDKFSSMHGQKGVIRMTYTQEDMPWTIQGITPDIIVNPHGISSRMTLGQLLECIIGKAAARIGKEGDATPFTNVTVESIQKALQNCGYQMSGFETMYNGETGKKLSAMIFLGSNYYQRLKHMVDDKIHSRARGRVDIMTRQPTSGRSRDGGIRFGEMERDCAIAHGATYVLKERLIDLSDPQQVGICGKCGFMTISILKKHVFRCKTCKSQDDIFEVTMPYAFKLLAQELMAMAVAPRMFIRYQQEDESQQ